MKRPLTDFFSDRDIDAAFMLSSTVKSFCFVCEDPLGQSHYRIHSSFTAITGLLCCTCAYNEKQGVIKRRNAPKQPRHHFAPLTEREKDMTDRFQKLPASAPAPAQDKTDFFQED